MTGSSTWTRRPSSRRTLSGASSTLSATAATTSGRDSSPTPVPGSPSSPGCRHSREEVGDSSSIHQSSCFRGKMFSYLRNIEISLTEDSRPVLTVSNLHRGGQFPRGGRHGEVAVPVQGVPQASIRLQGLLRRHASRRGTISEYL